MATSDQHSEWISLESGWSFDAVIGTSAKAQTISDNNASDDLWISSLLPGPSAPTLNRRKGRRKQDSSLYTDDKYKEAYQKISILSTEPLTNEEWTARRLQREREARAERQALYGRIQRGSHEGQQYFRTDQRVLNTLDQEETLVPQADMPSDERIRNLTSLEPRRNYHRRVITREGVIDRSRVVVSHAVRFLGSLPRRFESPSPSEGPAFDVGHGGVSNTNGPDRAGLDSFAGIRSERRGHSEMRVFDVDDESDADTAFWTTGTAMETVLESDSSCGSLDEAESATLFEEQQILESNLSLDDENVEWRHHPEGREEGRRLPEFSHDPFIQLKIPRTT